MKLHALHPFPHLSENITQNFKVSAGLSLSTSQLELKFRIEAKTAEDFQTLVLPKPSLGLRKDELWKATCFECFIPARGKANYLEFNGSPSGDWNWYAFQKYREGMTPVPISVRNGPKAVSLSKSAKELEMSWVLPTSGLVQGFAVHGESVAGYDPVGLTVVLQTKDATTYWALSHEGAKPDFHQRASFKYDPIRN